MDKDFTAMNDDELLDAHTIWVDHVNTATGWSSAYFAARTLQAITSIGNARGLGLTNPHPIRTGG